MQYIHYITVKCLYINEGIRNCANSCLYFDICGGDFYDTNIMRMVH